MTDNQSFLQALEKEFNSRFDKDFIELESKAPHSFSKKHNKQMEKLIKRQQKPYFRLISTTGRRVACSIVIFVVLSASALSVKAIREPFFDFISHIFSGHTVVTADSKSGSNYPDTIEEEYYISALPDGFVLRNNERNLSSIDLSYFKDDKYIFFSQNTKSSYKEFFDNEHTTFSEYTDEEGQRYLYIENNDDSTFVWDNGVYILKKVSNLDKDSVLELCMSTKVKY